MILSPEILSAYNKSRSRTDKTLACHAPFQNLNFEQNGNARACCYNTIHILGKWPQQSIKQIWEGQKANELRAYIRKNDFGGGCMECGRMIEAGNYQGVRAKYYDEFSPGTLWSRFDTLRHRLTGHLHYPRVMEFELSNQCNLECVMCNGYFSSSIRKNREKLPPIASPYNEKFVDELEEFIPHLTDAKFLGGEPFMIDIYLSIWERMLKLNPNIRIHITTNGTFLNNRIKELLEGLRAGIILSCDSIVKDTYQKIRVNGNYDKVMENLDYFMDYAARKKTFISMAACPIVYNWKELPGMLQFCLDKNIALYFNAVFTPFELSLREQTLEKQQEILDYLQAHKAPQITDSSLSPRNLSIRAYNDFVKLLKSWLDERKMMLQQKNERVEEASKFVAVPLPQVETGWSRELIAQKLLDITTIERKGLFDEEGQMKKQLAQLLLSTPPGMVHQSIACYLQLHESYHAEKMNGAMQEKVTALATLIDSSPLRAQMLNHLSTISPLLFSKWLLDSSLEEMKQTMHSFFNP